MTDNNKEQRNDEKNNSQNSNKTTVDAEVLLRTGERTLLNNVMTS